MLHQGRGELETVTGALLVRSHDAIRTDPYRLQVGLIGLEAMLRLFTEQEANDRAFTALTRFLDALDEAPPRPGSRAALDPVVLCVPAQAPVGVRDMRRISRRCVECGSEEPLVGFLAAARRWRVRGLRSGGDRAHSRRGAWHAPAPALADRGRVRASGWETRARREALAVVTASYEHHGGFRLKTVSA